MSQEPYFTSCTAALDAIGAVYSLDVLTLRRWCRAACCSLWQAPLVAAAARRLMTGGNATATSIRLPAAGFGRLQWLVLLYCGLAWLADACETMLLSFLGPAVRCAWGIGPGAESALTSVVFAGGCELLWVVVDW